MERRQRSPGAVSGARVATAGVIVASLAASSCEKAMVAVLLFMSLEAVLFADLVALIGLTFAMVSDRPPGKVQLGLSLALAGGLALVLYDLITDAMALDPTHMLRKQLALLGFLGQPVVLWPFWVVVLGVHRKRTDPRARTMILFGLGVTFALFVPLAVWAYVDFYVPMAAAPRYR